MLRNEGQETTGGAWGMAVTGCRHITSSLVSVSLTTQMKQINCLKYIILLSSVQRKAKPTEFCTPHGTPSLAGFPGLGVLPESHPTLEEESPA